MKLVEEIVNKRLMKRDFGYGSTLLISWPREPSKFKFDFRLFCRSLPRVQCSHCIPGNTINGSISKIQLLFRGGHARQIMVTVLECLIEISKKRHSVTVFSLILHRILHFSLTLHKIFNATHYHFFLTTSIK